MNKEEKILNEIKETRNHLRSLELEVSSLRLNKKRWKPSLGEVYYCINFGHVSRFINTFGVDDNISTGNYFQSKEEVSFEIERLKILEQLKSYSYSFTCKDWKDEQILKYFIYYNYETGTIEIGFEDNYSTGNMIYFISEKSAKEAIANIGFENLKRYYFLVGKGEKKKCQ